MRPLSALHEQPRDKSMCSMLRKEQERWGGLAKSTSLSQNLQVREIQQGQAISAIAMVTFPINKIFKEHLQKAIRSIRLDS
jgi:hypothetical protein